MKTSLLWITKYIGKSVLVKISLLWIAKYIGKSVLVKTSLLWITKYIGKSVLVKTSLLWITKYVGIEMQSYELRKTTQKRFFAESWLMKNLCVININNVTTLNLCVEDINDTMEFAVVSIQYHYLRGISPHVFCILLIKFTAYFNSSQRHYFKLAFNPFATPYAIYQFSI